MSPRDILRALLRFQPLHLQKIKSITLITRANELMSPSCLEGKSTEQCVLRKRDKLITPALIT